MLRHLPTTSQAAASSARVTLQAPTRQVTVLSGAVVDAAGPWRLPPPALGLRCALGPHRRCPAVKRPQLQSARMSPVARSGKGSLAAALPGPTVLVWLRQDLRTHDNPALVAAAQAAESIKGKVAFVYIWSPGEDASDINPAPGGAMEVWYRGALEALQARLVSKYGGGAQIIFRKGPYADALSEVAEALCVRTIHYNRRYEPSMRETDERLTKDLAASGMRLEGHPGFQLHEPEHIKLDMSKWVGHFGTLTPFSMACGKLRGPVKPLQGPGQLRVHSADDIAAHAGGLPLKDLGLAQMPTGRDGSVIDWAQGIRDTWTFGEDAALELLERFIAVGLPNYEAKRQYADARAVSRLSPYLHSGELSPRQMYHTMMQANAKQLSKTAWRRVVWRDLAYWQLHHWPALIHTPIRSHYEGQRWTDVSAGEGRAWLRAWQKGRTGYPLVDAGMRELWATGWMQQSVRMVCAAFLTEYLNIHWKEGAAWFHDTLVDADLAINGMMWQNAGKSGIDQWNFVINPVSNAQDPDGHYTRKWVPELETLPNKYMHSPWDAPPAVLHKAKVVLGQTYPERIITDLKGARADNVRAITAAKRAGAARWADAGGYDVIIVPEGSSTCYDGQRMRIFTKHEWRIKPDGEPAATATKPDGSKTGGKASKDRGAQRQKSPRPDRARSPKGRAGLSSGRQVRREKGWRKTGSSVGLAGDEDQEKVKKARRGGKQEMKKLLQSNLDAYLLAKDD